MDIDGVFSGGGVKGFALVGAIEVLEEKGFVFKDVAGTSAGAIVAAFLAAGYNSKEIGEMLHGAGVKEFMDPRKTLLPFSIAKWLLLFWRMGLYKGDMLEEWIAKMLARKGVYTFSDLPKNKLRVIASDLTNGRLLVLPDDLDHYGIPKELFPVAKAIRMSCSLPYFFEPVKMRSLSGVDITVDGGMLSNFPIWLFEKENNQLRRPVIGLKLSYNSEEAPKMEIRNGLQLFEAIFQTMKNAHDAKYISRKHEKNIIFIPVSEASTAEFTLTDKKKAALIESGRVRAIEFLKTWTY